MAAGYRTEREPAGIEVVLENYSVKPVWALKVANCEQTYNVYIKVNTYLWLLVRKRNITTE
jgi:hypothetical protein